jgi:[acyl-carrier-protein] S-malonyltransferase
MGKALMDAHPVARATFDEADRALGFSISRLCLEGPEADLRLTENTQPAILTASVAAFRVLHGKGVSPHYVAGHSLGEYAALVAAGALDFGDAVRIVRKRGRYMQEAVPAGVGAMAALVRLPEGRLDGILAEAAQGETIAVANVNSPVQVVIAGHAGAVNRALTLAKAAGANGVLLPVSAPFHCALMVPAQRRLKTDLDATPFRDLLVPLINNWRAAEVRSGEDARTGLHEQVPNPVLWVQSMRRLLANGVTRIVEVGPGTVLGGLMQAIDPAVERLKFGAPADWSEIETRLRR